MGIQTLAIWSLLVLAILFGIASASSYIWVYNSNDLLKEKDENDDITTEKSIQIFNIFSLVIIMVSCALFVYLRNRVKKLAKLDWVDENDA